MKIIEGNELIAKFMGWEVDKYTGKEINYFVEGQLDVYPKVVGSCIAFQHMKFHTSWDWLMPVVEKIEKLGFWVNIKKNHVTVAWDNKGSFDSKMIHSEFGDQSKIQRVYTCVVEFIKWYNEETVL